MSDSLQQPAPSAHATHPTHPTLQGTAVPIDPARGVRPRLHSTVDGAMLRVEGDAAVKQNTFPSWSGHPSGRAHWQTHLHVEAWVRNTTYAKHVWADLHVFGHDGALISSETCALEYQRPAGDGGDLFRLDGVVYEGATATPGSATPRPDARLVQYRLYCELDGQVFTDGLLHDCVLKADVVSP